MVALDLPEQYALPVSRSDWPELLAGWESLLPEGSIPWVFTKFGELFVTQIDGKVGMLQVSCFQYQVVAKDTTDFREWLVDPDKMAEWFLAPLVDRLMASGILLSPDHCYSFVQPLGLGGSLCVENVAVLSVRDHFRSWSKVFRQVTGLPPGTQIVPRQS